MASKRTPARRQEPSLPADELRVFLYLKQHQPGDYAALFRIAVAKLPVNGAASPSSSGGAPPAGKTPP